MKKAKQSNPLKTFNDNYDNRVKKVTEGNKKLVKAQIGLEQGPFQKSTIKKLDEEYPGTAFIPPKGPYSPEVLLDMKDRVSRPTSFGWTNKSILEKMDRENREKELREEGNFKKGGATKSKKK